MTVDQEIQALNKIVNSNLILSTYPNVGRIDISLHGSRNPYLVYKIFMTDENITKEEMYDDVDPFWLVDHHIMNVVSKLIPFEHLPIKGNDYQMIIYNGSGIPIFDWEHELSQMNPGSSGRSDWERRSNRE
jgi:hypothetical protein